VKTHQEMIRRYQLAHKKLSLVLASWKRESILENPEGRHAKDFSREVVALAENESQEILLTTE
jgi:hypothetical protein